MTIQTKSQRTATKRKPKEEFHLPDQLPFHIVSDLVLFPKMAVPLEVGKDSAGFLKHVLEQDRLFVLTTRNKTDPDSIYDVGTAVFVLRKEETSGGNIRLLLECVSRVKISELLPPDPFPRAAFVPLESLDDKDDLETKAMVKNVRTLFFQFLDLSPQLPPELRSTVASMKKPGELADLVAAHVDIGTEQKQEILEEVIVKERLKKVLVILHREVELLELGDKIKAQVLKSMNQNKRNYYLREQLKAIRQELGDTDEEEEFLPDLAQKIEEKKMPAEAREEAEHHYRRLTRISPSSSEFMVTHTYLEWLLDLPWYDSTEDNLDLAVAKRILDQDHFGLEKVKQRVLEFLAVLKLKEDHKGPILCFLGPPGTGKTSMGRSIARALGRKFYRFSLGGMSDEAEIRGHRRTYVGAMPGRIIQGLKRVGSNNPVLMLDEIDKLGKDFRGDPSSALLELLDPEQNDSFVDNYLNVKFDLSKVLFIATANQRDTIPEPLFDRMEMIALPGYTQEEKVDIARKYLIPKQLKEHGLNKKNLTFYKPAIAKIISSYTRESGLRNLERRIAAICRQVAHAVASGQTDKVTIKPADVVTYLGPPKIFPEVAQRTSVPGVATGLAWTSTGGEILFIEASRMKGHEKLVLTGKLGEVMQESAKTALSYLKSRAGELGIDDDVFAHQDIHIHVPAGAIPKDGPSAGVTILAALTSLLTERPVRKDVAMTGELTLRGLVLPVGGIKEKVLAAKRAGIKKILLPKQNNYDLMRLTDTIRDGLEFHLISHADEALELVLQDG